MNSLEDRLHNLADHLDKELRATATLRDLDVVSSLRTGDDASRFRSTALQGPVRLRTVTVMSAVLAFLACVGAGVVLLRHVDDSAASTSAPTPAPSPWDGGVGLIVYMRNGAPATEIDAVRATLETAVDLVTKVDYLDTEATLVEAQRLLANDPNSLAFLTADNVPTMFKVVPTPGATAEQLDQFAQTLTTLAGVLRADTPSQEPVTDDSASLDDGVGLVPLATTVVTP